MSRKKKTFTSIRVIGKKAHDLLLKAKTAKTSAGEQTPILPPGGEEFPEMVMHISMRSIVRATCIILAFIVGTWLLFEVHDKILLLLLAFFVAAIIDPGVRYLENKGVPRGLAVLLQYLLAVLLFVFLLLSLIPIIAAQLQQLALFITVEVDDFITNPEIALPFLSEAVNIRLTNLMQGMVQNVSVYEIADTLQTLGQNLSITAQGSVLFATRLAGSVLSFFVKTVIVLVLAFFIQSEKERIRMWLRSFFPHSYRQYIDGKTEAIHIKIGQWARGQLLLGLSIGLLVFLALTILRMPYAVTLAVLAGFTEFIPYVGPFIAAVPAVLIGLTQEGILWAAIIAGVYYVIQWCENNLLVPLIMKRAVGLSPIAIIFAMLIGVSFSQFIHPVLGLLLAVPTTTIIAIFLEDWRIFRERMSK
ncbi:hypothetical protein COU77_02645 [Candidatus Peregrinibacteria bacterium CG10_big_fil_rev_8_21_14_0_10_49_16]|nr:MAG: hypothetical protein COW95_02155 [Candidatus Peregrinibacteria bacterium CG22_combo_CG10-13_8_21_14_all_49_11]PIR51939.1 MAG: hypothetical protein COU77_02645 [Candidatus Peregrinibacteria bacterium CG10_big_fil_rev_8_21_14_0_10_49_16]